MWTKKKDLSGSPHQEAKSFHSGINGSGVKQIGRYLMNVSVEVTSELCTY